MVEGVGVLLRLEADEAVAAVEGTVLARLALEPAEEEIDRELLLRLLGAVEDDVGMVVVLVVRGDGPGRLRRLALGDGRVPFLLIQ